MRTINRARRRGVIAGAIIAALALAACGPADDNGDEPAAVDDTATDDETVDETDDATDDATDDEVVGDTVNLRFSWWGGDERHAVTQEVIDRFEDEHPNITVSGEFTGWGDYWDRLATTVAGGDAPDIIQQEERFLREYASRGSLIDLSEHTDIIDLSNIDESVLGVGELDGSLYGIVTGVNAYTIVADPQIFEEAGVELPDDTSWTWDDYADIATQISENTPDGVYGAQDYGFNEVGFQIFARQQGEDFFSPDGELAFSPETMEEWWQRSVDMRDSGATPPPAVTVEVDAGGPDQSLVATNSGAMSFFWTNQLGALATGAGRDLVLLRQPGELTNEQAGMYFKAAMYYSIAATTDHPEEAATFVDFLLNDERAGELILSDRGLPANEEIRSTVAPLLEPADVQASEFLETIEPDLVEPPPVPPMGAGEIVDIMRRLNEQVLFDQLTVPEAVEQFMAEVGAAIS